MAVVETEVHGQIMVIRLNRPERLNALGREVREGMGEAFTEFSDSDMLEVAILTGTGRGFCAGEDMKETLEIGGLGAPRLEISDPFNEGTLQKPVIAAINGYAMGGGFMLVERTDLRVAVKGAIFEMSEAKRWLLGGYNHGYVASLPHPIATEMALGFRFTAERLYEVGFLNRLVDPEDLMPTAMEMADHMLTLPPAARVNTIYMMRQMMQKVSPELEQLADALHEHGCKEDRMESRRAFAEKRKPQFKGWDDPQDRYRMPTLESLASQGDMSDDK
ncbi:MAG: enoyl-CoA hydratase/isomerase family protein [Chloroflexota bacterium]